MINTLGVFLLDQADIPTHFIVLLSYLKLKQLAVLLVLHSNNTQLVLELVIALSKLAHLLPVLLKLILAMLNFLQIRQRNDLLVRLD